MNIKKSILSCMLMLGFVSASAQQYEERPDYVFNPHWYVQVQPLGAQYTLGEISFGDLTSYNVQAALGYQFDKCSEPAWLSTPGSRKVVLTTDPVVTISGSGSMWLPPST